MAKDNLSHATCTTRTGFLWLVADMWRQLNAVSGLQAAKQHFLLGHGFLRLVAGVWQL